MSRVYAVIGMVCIVLVAASFGGCKEQPLYEAVTPTSQEMALLKDALNPHENGLPYRVNIVQRLAHDPTTWKVYTQLQDGKSTGGRCYTVKMTAGKCVVQMTGTWDQ